MAIKHKVRGESMQMIVCELGPGESVYAEAGKFLWKTANVGVETRLGKGSPAADPGGGGGGGLLKKAMSTATEMGKRALAGESLAFQHFTANGQGIVAFAGVLPGEMKVIELDGTRGWFAGKDSFVCAERSVDFDIAFSGFKAGRKGGEGFVLEKFTGSGTLVLAGAGNFIDLNPAKLGGKIQVDTGCVVAFEDTITYGVERIGGLSAQTVMSGIFGGEGLNLATLEGDGQVVLQSMTYEAIAHALSERIGRINQ